MDENKKDFLITLVICGSILLFVVSLIIRNYNLNIAELKNEQDTILKKFAIIEKMTSEGHEPMAVGCAFVTEDNTKFCSDFILFKEREGMAGGYTKE